MKLFPEMWVEVDADYCEKASAKYTTISDFLDRDFKHQLFLQPISRVWELEFCWFLKQCGFELLTREERNRHHFEVEFPDFIIRTEKGFIGIECVCPEDDSIERALEEEEFENGNAVWTNEEARILRMTSAVADKSEQYSKRKRKSKLDAYVVAVSVGRLAYLDNETIDRSLYGVGLSYVSIDVGTGGIVGEGKIRESFIGKKSIPINKVFLDPRNDVVDGIFIGQSASTSYPRNYRMKFLGRPESAKSMLLNELRINNSP